VIAMLLLILAVPCLCVSFCASFYLYWVTLEEVRPDLPPQFRERPMDAYAIDTWIWERSFPAHVRRNYLWAGAWMAISLACLAIIVHKDVVIAMLIAAGSMLSLGSVLWRLVKYRDRL
jgi:hypothetical protein